MLLNELLKYLDYRHLYNWNKNINISGISYDSRKIKTGHIFVALKGEQYDGCDFAEEVFEKGAVAFLAEKEPTRGYSLPWIQVSDSRLALAQLSSNLYGHPSRKLLLTGITGTCGKTTTSTLLHHIFSATGLKSGLIGTVHICCGEQNWPAKMTTPDALELQRLLRLMVESDVTHAAMEVSSHSLTQKRVEGIHFQGAVLTNISPNHLDYHLDLEEYVETKKRLVPLVKSGGFILANGDDPFFRNLKNPETTNLYFYGEHPSCDFQIHNVSLGVLGNNFALSLPCSKLAGNGIRSLHLKSRLLGRHNVYNAAAAVAVSLLLDIPMKNIREGLASFHGVERRMQIYPFRGMQIIDDTAMSPGSINAVFAALQEMSLTNPVIVFAIRGCRGTRVNEDNGRALARWSKELKVKHFFSTSSKSHVDEHNKVLPEEKDAFFKGCQSEGVHPIHNMELPETIIQALKVTKPGNTLLLLGAQGMDAGLAILWKQLKTQYYKSTCKLVKPVIHCFRDV